MRDVLFGAGKLIDPATLAHIFISPLQRTQTTLDALLDKAERDALHKAGKVTATKDIIQWDYGDYQGLLDEEIRVRRRDRGLDQDRPWDIWVDGCEGGEWV